MRSKFMQHKRWITSVMVLLLVVLWCIPLTAYAADYPTGPLDYKTLDYTVTEGAMYKTVSVPLSSKYFTMEVYTNTNAIVTRYQGMYAMTFPMEAGKRYNVFIYPVSNYGLLLSDLPEGSYLSFDLTVGYSTTENFYVPTWAKRSYFVNKSNSYASSIVTEGITGGFGDPFNVTYELTDYPDDANAFVPSVKIANIGTALASGSNDFQVIISNVRLVMDISTGYWEQWLSKEIGKDISDAAGEITSSIEGATSSITNKIDSSNNALAGKIEASNNELGNRIVESNEQNMEAIRGSVSEVGGQISQDISAATNEIMNGGAEGEMLDQKDDELVNSADIVNDGLASIESFQGQYMSAAQAELSSLVASADLTILAHDMNFVQTYTNKIFDAIPDAFTVVFTLPFLFGIVMYILGHPVRAPRPDTRETTTTTEILEGRHAGERTVTRTTSTTRDVKSEV